MLERGVVVVVGRDPAVGAILRPHCVLRHGGARRFEQLSGRLGRRARSRSRSQRRSTAQATACARPPRPPSCAPARSPTAPGCATRRVTSTPRSAHRIHPAPVRTPPAAGLSTAAVGRRLRRTDRPPRWASRVHGTNVADAPPTDPPSAPLTPDPPYLAGSVSMSAGGSTLVSAKVMRRSGCPK